MFSGSCLVTVLLSHRTQSAIVGTFSGTAAAAAEGWRRSSLPGHHGNGRLNPT